MTPDRARRLVLGAVVGAGIAAFIRDASRQQLPRARAALALLIVAAVLLALTDLSPQLAVGFAVLVLTSAALGAGPGAFTAVANALNRSTRRLGDTP